MIGEPAGRQEEPEHQHLPEAVPQLQRGHRTDGVGRGVRRLRVGEAQGARQVSAGEGDGGTRDAVVNTMSLKHPV